jgi:hypothetical protein
MSERPVLAEMDRLKAELALAQYDNTQLRLVRLQDDAVKQRQELEALLKTMAREGYTLNRDATTGQWTYVPVAPAPAAAPPPMNGKDELATAAGL